VCILGHAAAAQALAPDGVIAVRAALYMRAMADALDALQAPDPDLDAERAIIASARGEERDGP
jgi:hypothetical protein